MKKRTSHEKSRKGRKYPDASGVPVYCKFDRFQHPDELKAHPDNAHRTHPPKQLDRYEQVIAGSAKKPGNGWRRAVTVSDLSGCIVKGHGAWLMAKRRGWLVPVEVQHYTSRAEEVRDLLADNKLAEAALTDDAKLAQLLASMDAADLALAGFDATELENLLNETVVPEGEFPITAKLGEGYDYVLIFTTNATEFAFLQTITGVRQERSYKKDAIGLGRAIPFTRAIKSLYENRNSLDVAGRDHDHASADSKRSRVRAKKPAR